MAGAAQKDNPLGEAGLEALRSLTEQDDQATQDLVSLAARHFEKPPGSLESALQSDSCELVSDLGVAGRIVMCCFLVVLSLLASDEDFRKVGLDISKVMLQKMDKRGPWWRKGLCVISENEAFHLGLYNNTCEVNGRAVHLYTKADTKVGASLRRIVARVCEWHARTGTHAQSSFEGLSSILPCRLLPDHLSLPSCSVSCEPADSDS